MSLKIAGAVVFAGLLALAAAEGLAQDEARPLEARPLEARQNSFSGPPLSNPDINITVRGAKNEEEVKGKLRADALLARCVIKPVMTDAEIELCKTAYRLTDKYENDISAR
jgi:hypothetical protein